MDKEGLSTWLETVIRRIGHTHKRRGSLASSASMKGKSQSVGTEDTTVFDCMISESPLGLVPDLIFAAF